MVSKTKSKFVPVSQLTEEQRAKRRADQLRRKQKQRAREAGKTLDEYQSNIMRNETLRRERNEARRWEREIQANERTIRRNNPEAGSKRSRRAKKLVLPDIGTSTKKTKKEIKKLLKKTQLTKEEYEDLVIEATGGRVLPLEVRRVYESAQGHLNKWDIDGSNFSDPMVFLDRCKSAVKKMIDEVKRYRKVSIRMDVLYEKAADADPEVDEKSAEERVKANETTNTFRSGTTTINDDEDFAVEWSVMASNILADMSAFQKNGSGWVIKKLIRLVVYVDNYDPLVGRSWIPLPKSVKSKGAIVNLKNNDSKCFEYSVAACDMIRDYPDIKDLEKLPKILKTRASKLNMDGIPTPTKLDDITRFEKQNPGYNVVVFGLDEKDGVIPLRVKKRTDDSLKTVRLLLWGDMNENFHYSPIKSMSRLLSSQISAKGHKKFVCDNCCNSFWSEKKFLKHEEFCYSVDGQRVVMEDEVIKFKHVQYTQHVPFAVYADTEAFNIKLDDDSGANTVKLSEQKFNDGGYVIVGPDGFEPVYKKFNNVRDYVDGLISDVKKLNDTYFKNDVEMVMSDDDEQNYRESCKCYVCGWRLVDGENKNRDHDHFTGRYRGAACRKCNLAMKKPRFVPILFHNLEGYDSHLIIREIARQNCGELTTIPKNNESYISFSLKLPSVKDEEDEIVTRGIELRFLDSFKFLNKGLGNLVKTLVADDFKITNKLASDGNNELLKRKGVYPYDWVDGPDKMKVTELPPIECFHNTLNESECEKEDYEHAQNVWNEFKCKTFQDYHDLYLKTDILFLADVFEKFRATSETSYGIDPLWCYTTPGLAWDCMLKMTNIKLRTIDDIDKHLFIERATRGGISMITKRHAAANNKYMNDYHPKKESSYIMYFDRNNLYGEAMIDKLPTGNLEWMTDDELSDWENVPCFLEVDVEYPRELHDEHNEYPFLCEKMVVNGVEKLVPNLKDKKQYVCHYSELKLAVRHGLKITKVHSGLKFTESDWLKKYIDFNTNLRSQAKFEFEKDFYKLMSNAVYGKTIENVRNRVKIEFATTKKRLNKLIGMPNYRNSTNFENGPVNYFSAVNLGKPTVKLDKPIYVGAAVLSISKCRMYEFFYEYVKPKWGDNCRLLFTDTDSLCLEIKTEDVWDDIKVDVDEHFDTSNYRSDHPAVDEVGFPVGKNKKLLGKMKDECGGKLIVEFVGLRPKMYAIRMDDGEEVKKAKGTKKYVVDKNIRFADYKDCLFEVGGKSDYYEYQNTLQNKNHKIYVQRMRKKALSNDDDKRVILPGNVDTLAIGHWRAAGVV